MKTFVIELKKSKRTGFIPLMLAVGIMGAAYAFVNFVVRKDTLLSLPLAPMDILLTILDEPTNGLDPAGIHEIRNLIKSLPSLYDCTILISSHMLSEIELMADDIGILNHGRLLFEGSLDDLRQYALRSGFAADNLEEMFLSMIESDNLRKKQRAKL